MSAWELILEIYRALYNENVFVDFVDPLHDDLSRYHVLFVPSLMLLSDELEDALRSYVSGGGILIATPRTGAKDWNNNVVDKPFLGNYPTYSG